MDEVRAQLVRRFHRTVCRRLVALNEESLPTNRPPGASRLLREIGEDGTAVRALRARLDLDSGYLSRLIRSLVAEHLVQVQPDAIDHRVRVVRLTEEGKVELRELDDRTDEAASSILGRLGEAQQARLVDAMATVERLLTACHVIIGVEDPTTGTAQFCLRSYFSELDSRLETGFDPERTSSLAADELIAPAGLLLVARLDGEPVGCGAVRLAVRQPADIKRMWVAAGARGLGIGRRLLRELEGHALDRGATSVRLDTNRQLSEAISLYKSAGYREVSAFNEEPYAHHWFEKNLIAIDDIRLSMDGDGRRSSLRGSFAGGIDS